VPKPAEAETASILNRIERFLGDRRRPVIPLRNDYADGLVIPPHAHRRHQLLYGGAGVVSVGTPQGRWVMPPQRGLWIPAGVVHEVRMLGRVTMQSLYLEPGSVDGMPSHCQVLGIPPFMRALIAEAVELPADYALQDRALALMALIQHELPRLPALPLALPLPAGGGPLDERCQAFLRRPDAHAAIDDWAAALGQSRRSFTRHFREATGLSFLAWRQQACLVAALPRLAAGESVTAVALALGYDNPAAFTTMFKRALGVPPRSYFRQQA
jgi:AraC-like DNA-binding protein